MGDLSQPWGPQHENINFATSELSKANREKGYGNLSARLRKGSIVRSMRAISGRVKHHPMEKPVDILRQLIESSSVMGEVVYDPFAGSGSTLIASVLEGRIGVGCEFDERYCENAAKRFEHELRVAAPSPRNSLPSKPAGRKDLCAKRPARSMPALAGAGDAAYSGRCSQDHGGEAMPLKI
jgi:hypothetical protein